MKTSILKCVNSIMMMLLSAGAGCTAQIAYDSLRYNQESNCHHGSIEGCRTDGLVRETVHPDPKSTHA